MGVIDLCLKYDIDYAPITKALATAFAYVESRDPNAVKIQKDIQKNGIRPTVSKYIGRPEDDVVVDRVVNNYKQLQQEATASVMTPGA
jgi:mannitol-1-phosphate 5-dehydrogenase